MSGSPYNYNIKVIFAGPTGAGKTTLLKRVNEGIFTPEIKKTIGVDFHLVQGEFPNRKTYQAKIWDLSGDKTLQETTNLYLKDSQFVVLVVNGLEDFSSQTDQLISILKTSHPNTSICVLVTKGDSETDGFTLSQHDLGKALTSLTIILRGHAGGRKIIAFKYPVSACSGAHVDDFRRFFAHELYQLVVPEHEREDESKESREDEGAVGGGYLIEDESKEDEEAADDGNLVVDQSVGLEKPSFIRHNGNLILGGLILSVILSLVAGGLSHHASVVKWGLSIGRTAVAVGSATGFVSILILIALLCISYRRFNSRLGRGYTLVPSDIPIGVTESLSNGSGLDHRLSESKRPGDVLGTGYGRPFLPAPHARGVHAASTDGPGGVQLSMPAT